MTNPVILALADESDAFTLTVQELRKRYGNDYQVDTFTSASQALDRLNELRELGHQVALILVSYWMDKMDGADFLDQVHHLHPNARRGLLVKYGDPSAALDVLRAINLGVADDWGSFPVAVGDEGFHSLITRFLEGWSREHHPLFELVRIVGERWDRRSYELRDLLRRNGISYGFYDVKSSEGRALLEASGYDDDHLPVLVLMDGRSFANPSKAELADALESSMIFDITGVPKGKLVDVVIVGAGPAGLSAAVYGASEGLQTVVIEREAIGGQAGMSSRIRNYLGFPTGISGRELAARAYRQAWLFGADFAFAQTAVGLEERQGALALFLDDGSEVLTKTVVLTMGVSYRRLGIPALEELIGAGVFYGSSTSEALMFEGKHVFVIGGGNSAAQSALHLANYAEKVTILVRSRSLSYMSEYLVHEIENVPNIYLRRETQVVDGGGERRLEWLALQKKGSSEVETVPAEAAFVLIGAIPHTDWLPETIQRVGRGYIVTGPDLLKKGTPPQSWPLKRQPLLLETSMPGVFAAGDVRHRSVKRVASAVGEGSITIKLIHQYLFR
ncbi:MAG: FAD-dependent oxidoreductase [Anaerolineales bacterium]|jgi:thioredoxin reductase (NADPH)